MRNTLTLALVLALVLSGTAACRRARPTVEPASPTAESAGAGGKGLASLAGTPGVRFRLSDGDSGAPGATPDATVIEGEALSDERAASLLGRLPELEAAAAVTSTFAFRSGPRPPRLTGDTVQAAFPPAASPPPPEAAGSGPLEVVRMQPQGDVELAALLAVSFSQPMVPLATLDALAAEDVPVRLSPLPPGQWRWAGTKTLLFEPEERFPMATEYTAEVPAGTSSAVGGTLDEAVTWTFRTPPPRLVRLSPAGRPVDLQPVFVAEFDQRVRPEDVLAHAELALAGSRAGRLRLADPAEVAADEAASAAADDALEGRWVALRPAEPMPAGAAGSLTFRAGMPSAEGTRVTEAPQARDFEVRSALRVTRARCTVASGDWSDERQGETLRVEDCDPTAGFLIEFNNPLDASTLDGDEVGASPEIEDRVVSATESALHVWGRRLGRTEYRISLPSGLGDTFGTALGEGVSVVFVTGDAPPSLAGPERSMVVLDPAGPRSLGLVSVNNESLAVTLYRVTPDDWSAYLEYSERGDWDSRQPPAPPGEEVWTGTLEPGGERDVPVEVAVDLTPALSSRYGHVVVVARPSVESADEGDWRNRPVIRWAQSTDLALSVVSDGLEVRALVTSLAAGEPVAGARVSLEPEGGQAATGPDGLAVVPALPAATAESWPPRGVLVARSGSDTVFAAHSEVGGSWVMARPETALAWYVFDDRALYRPGETARLKGWIRRLDPGRDGDLEALDGGPERVSYGVTAANGVEVLSGTVPVDDLGGFDLDLVVPEDIELGPADVRLSAEGGDMQREGREQHHSLAVAEFRRPEFEVVVTPERETFVAGPPAGVTARAAYYAGGSLADAEVRWVVTGSPTFFDPPGHDDFQFGSTQPWPLYGRGYAVSGHAGDWRGGDGWPVQDVSETHTGRTGGTGEHRLDIDLTAVEPLAPVAFQAEATVQDVNRQAVAGRAALVVHPAARYVGLRPESGFARAGRDFRLDAIVVDLDGAPAVGTAIALAVERVGWETVGGQVVEKLEPVAQGDLVSTAEPVAWSVRLERGGQYRVSADIVDDEGRPNRTTITLYAAGAEAAPDRSLPSEALQLVPDKSEYAPGETARILVVAPFAPAEGWLWVSRSGVVRSERFRMEEASTTLEVPIEESWLPNVVLQASVVGAAEREVTGASPQGDGPEAAPAAGRRPAYASGTVEIEVLPVERTLAVSARPAEADVAPGAAILVEATVLDHAGSPVEGAGVTLVVVDEAVLALTAHEYPDPIEVLYPRRWGASSHDSRQYLQLAATSQDIALPPVPMYMTVAEVSVSGRALGLDRQDGPAAGAYAEIADAASLPGLRKAANESAGPTPSLRTDLDPLAAFVPDLRTGADGRVTASVDLPDNVTRYRVLAVATDGGRRFGKGEGAVTARLPLVIRPALPRFLNFGDTFDLAAVVQNNTQEPVEAEVVVRAANLLPAAARGRRVSIPAGQRVEVRFPTEAGLPGTAAVQMAVFGPDAADAQLARLPIWTPATTEAFATYGGIDEGGVVQPVTAPEGAVPQFGGLEVETSSTALAALTDAWLYLRDYPYEGSEQVASRLVAAVALSDVLAAFGAAGARSPEEVGAAIDRDIARLAAQQRDDGGWAWWPGARRTDPFVSVHVAHALARARAKGHQVPAGTIEVATAYLTDIAAHLDAVEWLDDSTRRTVRAYALFVRSLVGSSDTAAARALMEESDERSIETLGWLLAVLAGDDASAGAVAEIERELGNRASEEAATAQFAESYEEAAGNTIMASNRRSDAVVLEALIGARPQSPLVPKLARGLLAHRSNGRWDSTQENAFVLLALDRYFRAYESVTPDFVARAWLGEGYLGQSEYRGRSADRWSVTVPTDRLPAGEEAALVLQKEGDGRLYYRLGLRYVPDDLDVEPLDRGFAVERAYRPVDDPADVRRTAEGTWEVRPGARVRVELTMVAAARRYHVALVDWLPAGFEAQDTELATTGSVPEPMVPEDEGDGGAELRWWSWFWPWYEHTALRDERTEAFASLLEPGVHTFRYVARATTPGRYVVPPARAEELYHPETFGRTATDRVVVR